MSKILKHPYVHTEVEEVLVGANHCYLASEMVDDLVYGKDEIHCIVTADSGGRLRHLYDHC
jgi:hypothetical protein